MFFNYFEVIVIFIILQLIDWLERVFGLSADKTVTYNLTNLSENGRKL